ncbi:protein kinase domain-containing protein [Candidatus Berkiella aquae]|uniref:Protein kinase domain protein n=1 Tax=Candidatus Berkiella aquae TaxID=295108 RepID=A0A0Q9YC55_9GAMM|nr:protein kinase family protein [Candidatus Berkiella aquae]MCS5711024.1 hypothetical protein [Candidatus Berkiella aquae]
MLTCNQKHDWTKILSEEPLYKEIHENSETYDSQTIDRLKKELSTAQKKIKRDNDSLKFSIIAGKNKGLFSLYHGTIDQGNYGRVKLARDLENNELYLMKHQFRGKLTKFKAECKFSKWAGILEDRQYIDPKHNYLFIKIVEGVTLARFKELALIHPLTSMEEIKLALSFLKALEHLFGSNIKHNDLHHRNIMIDPTQMKVTFIDYGEAEELGEESAARNEDIVEACKAITSLFSESPLHKIFKKLKHDCKLEDAIDAIKDLRKDLTRRASIDHP